MQYFLQEMREIFGILLVFNGISAVLAKCDQSQYRFFCFQLCNCISVRLVDQRIIKCNSSTILKDGNNFLLKNAVECAANQGFNISLKLITNETLEIPWKTIQTKPKLKSLDLHGTRLQCSCHNAWIHWFKRLKEPVVVEDQFWSFQSCPECKSVSTHMIFDFPDHIVKPKDDYCWTGTEEESRERLSDFTDSNCGGPELIIGHNGSRVSCSLTNDSKGGKGCVAINIRSFFGTYNINSSLVPTVTTDGRSASIDTTNATTVDSGWLICTQNSSHMPAALITRIVIHDSPIVLEILEFSISPKDLYINITFASAEPINIRWFYSPGWMRNNLQEMWEIVPNATSQFLLDVHSGGFYQGWITTTLTAAFHDPNIKCNGGDYIVQACNQLGCASASFYAKTTRPHPCARINETFLVIGVFCIPTSNLTSDLMMYDCSRTVQPQLVYETFENEPPENVTVNNSNLLIYAAVGVGFLLAVCALLSIVCGAAQLGRKQRRRKLVEQMSMITSSEGGGTELTHFKSSSSAVNRILRGNQSSYGSFLKGLSFRNEVRVIPSSEIQVMRELGQGAFGCVYLVQHSSSCKTMLSSSGSRPNSRILMRQNSITSSSSTSPLLRSCRKMSSKDLGTTTLMAMKLLKFMSPEKLDELEREARVLMILNHPNIVQFYGVSILADKGFGLLFEFMAKGDLVSYLRDHNPDLVDEPEKLKVLSYTDLLQISLQVVSGLAYLADQLLVHRDLAARNCLVAQNGSVKISDFGMTRDLCTTDYYKMGMNTLVPVRWMPPECVLYRKFTTESDMWSFGVLSYEIWSYGQIPWNAYSNAEVMEIVKRAQILEKPDRCPEQIYEYLILGCCKPHPGDRLTAKRAKTFLESLLEKEMDYLSCI